MNAQTRPSSAPADTPRDDAPDAIGPSDAGALPGGRVDGGSSGGRQAVDFDDDEIYSNRGNHAREGGTDATGSDSAPLGPPAEEHGNDNLPFDRQPAGEAGRRAR